MTRHLAPSSLLASLAVLLGGACVGGGGVLGPGPIDFDDDDSAAADDDDVVPQPQVDCGPILELPEEAAAGWYLAGEGVVVPQGAEEGSGSWDGCRVERTYEDGELACEVLYDTIGTVVRANLRFYVFEVEYARDDEQSTCDDGRSFDGFVRVQFDDRGVVQIWTADEFAGAETAWTMLARSDYSEGAGAFLFDWNTEFEVTEEVGEGDDDDDDDPDDDDD